MASLQIQCIQDVKPRKCALAGRPTEAERKQQIAKWHDFGSWTEGRHEKCEVVGAGSPSQDGYPAPIADLRSEISQFP